jgi:hypothetical protein
VDEHDSDVDVDIEDDDDREEPLDVNDSSELDEELRLLRGKNFGSVNELNGEAERGIAGRRIGSIAPEERSERGEVSSIR